MELTTTSTLALFETTKNQRQTFVNDIVNKVIEGEIDVLKVHMQAKCTEQLMKELTDNKEYRSCLLEQAKKHGKKFETYNSEFEVKEAGVSYNYTVCMDEKLEKMYDDLDELKSNIKERENMLKSLPQSGLADPETGSMLYPPIKNSTTIVQCTLK